MKHNLLEGKPILLLVADEMYRKEKDHLGLLLTAKLPRRKMLFILISQFSCTFNLTLMYIYVQIRTAKPITVVVSKVKVTTQFVSCLQEKA